MGHEIKFYTVTLLINIEAEDANQAAEYLAEYVATSRAYSVIVEDDETGAVVEVEVDR